MTEKELLLAAHLLELAASEFGDHGCNDLSEYAWEGWSKKERIEFIQSYHRSKGNMEEAKEKHLYLEDYCVMSFLAERILESLKQNPNLAPCLHCGVPMKNHGTCCGWINASVEVNLDLIVIDPNHPAFGRNLDAWKRNYLPLPIHPNKVPDTKSEKSDNDAKDNGFPSC